MLWAAWSSLLIRMNLSAEHGITEDSGRASLAWFAARSRTCRPGNHVQGHERIDAKERDARKDPTRYGDQAIGWAHAGTGQYDCRLADAGPRLCKMNPKGLLSKQSGP